jgi:hypothetical protein
VHEVEILPADKRLLIAMREREIPTDLGEDLFEFDTHFRRNKFLFEERDAQAAAYREAYKMDVKDWEHFGYVAVVLLEPLQLLLRGTKQAILKRAACAIPAPKGKQVGSVNQAYSIISEIFEPGRMSHTGNVFERARYQDDNGIWRPLRVLRDHEEANYEQQKLVGKHRTQHASNGRAEDAEPKLEL